LDSKIKVLAVVGPTASGKTALSLSLAEALDGEIISCDSMQIYRDMNIGTAKPSMTERRGIPHHLFDICSPEDEFSCADYIAYAEKAIADVVSRGKTPIFCGGTGLYLSSVLRGGNLSPNIPCGIRESLEKRSPDENWEELIKIDPEAASLTHKNNVKRVIRALEIYHGTGKTKTEWDKLSLEVESPYDALIFGLDYRSRDTLYERINKRVDTMMDEGLEAEVREVAPRLGKTASQAIGYKELIMYINDELPYGDAVELLKKNTRNYAKRQLTWFRRDPSVIWSYPDENGTDAIFENIVNIAKKHLN
jgi:tRNA dimethylallyltransferase